VGANEEGQLRAADGIATAARGDSGGKKLDGYSYVLSTMGRGIQCYVLV